MTLDYIHPPLYTSPRRVDDAGWVTIHFLFTIRPYNAERLNVEGSTVGSKSPIRQLLDERLMNV